MIAKTAWVRVSKDCSPSGLTYCVMLFLSGEPRKLNFKVLRIFVRVAERVARHGREEVGRRRPDEHVVIDRGNPPTQSTRYRGTSGIGVSVVTRGLGWQ